MCKYCERYGYRNDLMEFESVKGNLYAYILNTPQDKCMEIQASDPAGDGEYDASFSINYCPMCGRKLVKSDATYRGN